MDLCTPRAMSNLADHHSNSKQLFSPAQPHLQWKPSLPPKPTSISLSKQGLHSYKYSSLRSTTSDETSSGTSHYVEDEADGMITFEDRQPLEEKQYGQTTPNTSPPDEPVAVINMEDRLPSEAKEYGETVQDEVPEENPLLDVQKKISDVQKKISEFLDQLNMKISDVYINMHFDSEESYSVFLFGGTATAALWFATAVVGAIDSIPVFPKVMEVVGLGYTLWFSTRYLIFKRNRDELAAKIEEIKEKVLGSEDD